MTLRTCLWGLLAMSCSFFMAMYLNFDPQSLIQIIIFGLLFYILNKQLWILPLGGYNPRVKLLLGLFSIVFAASIILGYHIKITGSPYNGNIFESYIEAYSPLDLISFVFIVVATYLFAMAIFGFFIYTKHRRKAAPSRFLIWA